MFIYQKWSAVQYYDTLSSCPIKVYSWTYLATLIVKVPLGYNIWEWF